MIANDVKFPWPAKGYADPGRKATQQEVNFFNEALAERGRRPLTMSQASRNALAQRFSTVNDFHSLFR